MATVAEALSSSNDLLAQHNALLHQVRTAQRTHKRNLRALVNPQDTTYKPLLELPPIASPHESQTPSPTSPIPQEIFTQAYVSESKPRRDLPAAKRARMARYSTYIPEEETIRNDYSQRYVDGGEWPQNWVLGAEPERRFEEYPKQQRLLALKKTSVNSYSTPPSYLPLSSLSALLQPRRLSHSRSPSITTTNIQSHASPSTIASTLATATAIALEPSPSTKNLALPTIPGTGGILSTATCAKFDVILIDPPFSSSFSWQHLQDMPIPSLAADPSFVFLWVGSGAGEGLERGREVLGKWGYRRCEDVCWIKTNKESNKGPGTDPPTTSLLTRTKQHCLIGIRGTVRRSTDSWFVHCNVDTDVIIWEGDPDDPTVKPPEMYTLVENFCLGLRRLEIFGRARSVRRGWVTVLADGEEQRIDSVKEKRRLDGDDDREGKLEEWERENWEGKVKEISARSAAVNVGGQGAGKAVVPMTPEIDALRPKSPVRGGGGGNNSSATPNQFNASTSSPSNLGNMSMPLSGSPSMGVMQKMGMNMGGGRMGGNGGFKNPNNMRMGGAAQNQMNIMATGIGGMAGMNGIGGMGMGVGMGMGGDGMWGGDSLGGGGAINAMGSMPGMVNMGAMGMGGMQGMGNMSMQGMGNMGMGGMMGGGEGYGGFDQQWDEGGSGVMWEDGSGIGQAAGVGGGGGSGTRSSNGGIPQAMTGMGGMQGMTNMGNMVMQNMGDMSGLQMGGGMGGMGMQGMGMGQMGHGQQRQWNSGTYGGYQ